MNMFEILSNDNYRTNSEIQNINILEIGKKYEITNYENIENRVLIYTIHDNKEIRFFKPDENEYNHCINSANKFIVYIGNEINSYEDYMKVIGQFYCNEEEDSDNEESDEEDETDESDSGYNSN